MVKININTDNLIKHTNRLEKLRKSALPAAIRGTLNDAVYDVKTNTLLESSKVEFINRQPNFFKANSKFEKANGFNINQMAATIGMVSTGLQSPGSNYAVEDLEQQEEGGTIEKRTFIPTEEARIGKSSKRPVRANARLKQIRNLANTKKASGKNEKVQFVKTGVFVGKGGYMVSKNILWRINSVKRLRNGNTVFNKTKLYSFDQGRSVNVKPTHFMRKASLNTANKLNQFFLRQAERQINKL
jgi:hypothetical protein